MEQAVAALPSELFNRAACGIALLDKQGHVQWSNPRLADLLGVDAEMLHGDPAQLPAGAHQALTAANDTVSLQHEGNQRWLHCEMQAAGEQSLVIVHDVTTQQALDQENQRLRQQVEELKLTDDLTGLPNKRAITQAMELQISRSRRYQNPLSLIMVHIAVADEQLELLETGAEPLVLGVSRFLRDRLRWVDQIGRWEDNIFVLVLPETSEQDTQNLIDKIKADLPGLQIPPPLQSVTPVLSFGSGHWHKGDDMRTLLRSTRDDLAST